MPKRRKEWWEEFESPFGNMVWDLAESVVKGVMEARKRIKEVERRVEAEIEEIYREQGLDREELYRKYGIDRKRRI